MSTEAKVVVLALLILGVGLIYTNLIGTGKLTSMTVYAPEKADVIISEPQAWEKQEEFVPSTEIPSPGEVCKEAKESPLAGFIEGFDDKCKTAMASTADLDEKQRALINALMRQTA